MFIDDVKIKVKAGRGGRPCIAGTGITVHRIATWYKIGYSPEKITRRYGHLTEAQVYAALTYYHTSFSVNHLSC